MNKFWRTPEYLALQRKWYKRLERSGFDDLEYQDYRTGEPLPDVLRRNSTADLARLFRSDKERYYQLACQFLWEMRRWDGKPRVRPGGRSRATVPGTLRLWGLHCAGLGNKEIARRTGLSADTVAARLRRIRAMMFEWLRREPPERP